MVSLDISSSARRGYIVETPSKYNHTVVSVLRRKASAEDRVDFPSKFCDANVKEYVRSFP